jgi:hypothetical protein
VTTFLPVSPLGPGRAVHNFKPEAPNLASWNDIPPDLRVGSAKPGFCAWLGSMPITSNAKRRIAQLWSANTQTPLDAVDYAVIMDSQSRT